jgi:hypothetical protein
MITIPTYQQVSSRYVVDVDLNGIMYSLQFLWNTRDNAWYMDIYLQDTVVLSGIKIVPNYALLYQYQGTPNIPAGEFFVVDTDENNPYSEDITFENFGVRYILTFATTEEILNGV